MSLLITPINTPALAPAVTAVPSLAATAKTPGAFESVFADALETVGKFNQDSQQHVERFLSGEGEELHSMVMSTQRAQLAFELFQQVRNKVVQAYQEVMRMQM